MRHVIIFLILSLAIFAGDVSAQVALTGGRKASFQDKETPTGDKASFVFVKETALTIVSPLCPAVTTLQFSSSSESGTLFVLPCDKWSERGSGYQYRDKSGILGGLQKLLYKSGKLAGKIRKDEGLDHSEAARPGYPSRGTICG